MLQTPYSSEEDSGLLGVKKELNCVPMQPDLMQKGVYVSYTPRFKIAEALGSCAVGD